VPSVVKDSCKEKGLVLQTISKPIRTLKQQIATSRERLQILYDTHGTTDAEVLAAGIELDELLNQYDKLTRLRDLQD
jgi:Spo0E like sporulation regulatory protein